MGEVIPLPMGHAFDPAASKPKSSGAACAPFTDNAVESFKNFSEGIRPRAFQLLTAGRPTPARSATADVPPNVSITASTVVSIVPEYSRFVNKSSLHRMAIVTSCEFRPNVGMSRSLKDIAARLQVLEDAVAESAAELCREAKIAPNAWSQFKNPAKKRRITMEAAYKLKDRYGTTLEWIYDGELHTLPSALAKAINKVSKAA